MKKVLIVTVGLFLAGSLFAGGRDMDGDGINDWHLGGTDRDLDNDGWNDWYAGGTDRDLNNDGWADRGVTGRMDRDEAQGRIIVIPENKRKSFNSGYQYDKIDTPTSYERLLEIQRGR